MRIVYQGFLALREEVLKIESHSTAFLHVCDVNAFASIICFLSKMFEYMYMVSGMPVLSIRIGEIPDEYCPFVIEIPLLTNEGGRDAIDRVVNMLGEERTMMGCRACESILNKKNARAQGEKMLAFVRRGVARR